MKRNDKISFEAAAEAEEKTISGIENERAACFQRSPPPIFIESAHNDEAVNPLALPSACRFPLSASIHEFPPLLSTKFEITFAGPAAIYGMADRQTRPA